MIDIVDEIDHPRPDVWPSEIRVKKNKALRKLVKHLQNPKARSEEAKKVLSRLRRRRAGVSGSTGTTA